MTEQQAGWMKGLVGPLRVKPGSEVDLPRDFDPGGGSASRARPTGRNCSARAWNCWPNTRTGWPPRTLGAGRAAGSRRRGQRQHDPARDGGVDPQGVRVSSFKEPSAKELRHDYLWWQARQLPHAARSRVHRSHYENARRPRPPELLEAEKLRPGSRAGNVWNRATGESMTGSAT